MPFSDLQCHQRIYSALEDPPSRHYRISQEVNFCVSGERYGVADDIHTRVAKYLGRAGFSECIDGAYQTNRN